jgi:hypothetical protein
MADQLPSADRSRVGSDAPTRRWGLIYAGVMLFAALVILLLLQFSRHFSG